MASPYRTIPLGVAATVRSGYAFKSDDWANEGVPVVKIANVRDGTLAMQGCSFVPPDVADAAPAASVHDGDILIAMTGNIGVVARVRDTRPLALNQRVGRFTITRPDLLDTGFLFYVLRSPDVRAELAGLGYGSVQANVSPSLIEGVRIPLPPLPEQKAIAHVLGTLDDKIELNRRMNETLEAMARAIFKSWFVDFDPVWAKKEGRQPVGMDAETAALFPDDFEDSELGPIPRGWSVGCVGDLVEVTRDTIQPSDYPDEVFDHYSFEACDAGCTPARTEGAAMKSGKLLVPADSVLLSRLNPSISRLWLPWPTTQARSVASSEFLVVRGRRGVPRTYFYSLFGSASFREAFEGLATGTSTSHQRVRPSDFSDIPAAWPPREIIQRFDGEACGLLARARIGREEAIRLAGLRDVVLPKLMSGELRVGGRHR
jgi:type I restriction enzyme S subunit